MVNIAVMPEGRQALRDQYWSPDAWRTSAKGNAYVRCGELCVTVFPARGGFRYAIARTAKDRPMFSPVIYATSDEARRAAWAMLPKAFA